MPTAAKPYWLSVMALKLFPISFPIFSPPSPPIRPLFPVPNPSPVEVRFSRWNNANAEKFNQRRRAQQQIEDEYRRRRRFNSIDNIAGIDDSATEANEKAETTFRSIGTPSSPSAPSIPGRRSKYSKPESGTESHPAFCRNIRIRKTPQPGGWEQRPAAAFSDRKADLRIGEDGVSYVIDGAPFEFKYSYTETSKVKPVKLREAPYSPFGPTTMGRPWTGRAPLPPSKKKLKEFDSFVLPPPGKKGVKPVQAPGPFRPESGPRHVKTREEILGEPLTKEEIRELVDGSLKSKRQLNMGRDGLTHNMLDNIHAHWKRRRVCKIKCKGVCTVDMDNVCQQLEEKTGGKIIDRKGGVLYLFRGRNYNHRTRPRFPLMLWKPASPVYPRLVQRVPEGLKLEGATEMRKKGRNLIPICKLGKNGMYSNLVRHVREAFGECELVRINCKGLNPSDYRKIGAKLRDLVPCVLISFEHEHILMWRGKDWKPFTKPVNDCEEGRESNIDGSKSVEPPTKDQESETVSGDYVNTSELEMQASVTGSDGEVQDPSAVEIDELHAAPEFSPTTEVIYETETTSETSAGESECTSNIAASEVMFKIPGCSNGMSTAASTGAGTLQQSVESVERLNDASEGSLESEPAKLSVPYVDKVLQLWKQAVESGTAAVLVDAHLDADAIFQKSVALAKSAPPCPVFRRRPKKVAVEDCEKQETANLEAVEVAEVVTVPKKDRRDSKSSKLQKRIEFSEQFVVSVPKGSLGLDELAKLLT